MKGLIRLLVLAILRNPYKKQGNALFLACLKTILQ